MRQHNEILPVISALPLQEVIPGRLKLVPLCCVNCGVSTLPSSKVWSPDLALLSRVPDYGCVVSGIIFHGAALTGHIRYMQSKLSAYELVEPRNKSSLDN